MASTARSAALLSYFLLQCLGIAISMLILQVQRAPLPREEIAALAEAAGIGSVEPGPAAVPWQRARISLSSLPGAFEGQAELQQLQQSLAAALAGEGAVVSVAEAPPAGLLGVQGCGDGAGAPDAARACLTSLEELVAAAAGTSDALPANEFDVLVVPAQDCSSLLLSTGRSAVLRWHRSGQLTSAEQLGHALAKRLRETWLRRAELGQVATLFEVAPAYIFSFFLVGDCSRRIAWDFEGGVLAPFLRRFLARLQRLVDFEIDSQVVQCGSLGGSEARGEGGTVDAAMLQADFLRRANEWPGDTLSRGARWLPPLVRFVAFKHSGNLRIVDSEGQQQRSFAVQGWGTVAVTSESDVVCQQSGKDLAGSSENRTAQFLAHCEAQQVASAWVSNLRSWLKLPPDAPVPGAVEGASCSTDGSLALHAAKPRFDGITDWELLQVARSFHAHFIKRTAETLQNLLALVDSLPDVVVREEIGEMAFEAAAAARHAASAAEEGDLAGALAAGRRGLALALTASHDDTVVAQMYFSWEFKYAVYLPISLPILVPVTVAVVRNFKRERQLRKLKLKGSADAAASVTSASEEEVM
mmetsp:Transcript_56151/g.174062  ORF Transcript_56151/g.174062 Transcript_56151/m.174062 type:complete len:585 (-) Transcript_56151:13-1767(-)